MWTVLTPEMQKAMAESHQRQFEQLAKDAEAKRVAREQWERSHPPCPHCGRRDSVPPWLL